MTWPDEPFGPAEAQARGLTPSRLRHERATGSVLRLRRGAYLAADQWDALRPDERHRLRVLAAGRTLRDPVFSHRSAAALWRLPLLDPWPDDVQVTGAPARGGRSRPGVRWHAASGPIPAAGMRGFRVTDLARTVLDLARTEPFASALMAADAALRSRRITADDLAAQLDAAGRGRGVRAARLVVAAADARAESAGESLSRARVIELGLPLPDLQHGVHDSGRLVARVDFWWESLLLVGEFDGRVKYRLDGVDDRRSVEDRLWGEKLREDELRALGLRVVRWTWNDALHPARLGAILGRAGLHPAHR